MEYSAQLVTRARNNLFAHLIGLLYNRLDDDRTFLREPLTTSSCSIQTVVENSKRERKPCSMCVGMG